MDEQFIVALFDNAKTYEQWRSIINFGMGTLLKNQGLLMSVITKQAAIMAAENPGYQVSCQVEIIMADLRLYMMQAPCAPIPSRNTIPEKECPRS